MRSYVFLIVIVFVGSCFAQQDPLFSQYTFNKTAINPAVITNENEIEASFFHKRQWTKIEDGPTFQNMSVIAPIRYNSMGIGMNVHNDWFRELNRFGVWGMVNYRLNIAEGIFAFGLELGLNQHGFRLKSLEVKDQDDPVVEENNLWEADIGAGFFYRKSNWYLGFSSKHLRNKSFGTHHYLIGGVKLKLFNNIDWIPSFLLKSADLEKVSSQGDITSYFKFLNSFWVGISYRTNNVLGIQAGLDIEKLNPKLYNSISLGYAYEQSMGNEQIFQGATHEIMIQVLFEKQTSLKSLKQRHIIISPKLL